MLYSMRLLLGLVKSGAIVTQAGPDSFTMRCARGHEWRPVRDASGHAFLPRGWWVCPECRRQARARPLRLRSLPTSSAPAPQPAPRPTRPAVDPARQLIPEADRDLALGASTAARRR